MLCVRILVLIWLLVVIVIAVVPYGAAFYASIDLAAVDEVLPLVLFLIVVQIVVVVGVDVVVSVIILIVIVIMLILLIILGILLIHLSVCAVVVGGIELGLAVVGIEYGLAWFDDCCVLVVVRISLHHRLKYLRNRYVIHLL